MKLIILYAALFAVALAAPAPKGEAEIVRSDSDVQPESFKFGYETSDGSKHDAAGHLDNVGTDHESLNVHGSFSWVTPEGKQVTITYVADENGYQPIGEDIPKAA